MLSEQTFFVTERITDILKLEKEVKFSDDVKKGISELRRELSRICDYLRQLDEKLNNKIVLSDLEQQFYFNLSCIVDSSDDILDRVFSKDDVGHDINDLLQKIRNSFNLYSTLFPIQVVGNTNMIGYQIVGSSNLSMNSPKHKQVSRPISFGHYPNPDIVGFNHEIQTLLKHLLQPHEETRFVGIVGMGGSGKTTLAKHIYHHPQINTHFTCKVWVCISQSWDKTSILNQIWRQATQDPTAPQMGYDQVVSSLYEFLSSQSYLIILDDIWSINAWYDIYPAFSNEPRCKVVITTRNKSVAKHIDPNVLIVEMKPLNDEESYALLVRKTCLPNERIPSDLIPLGKEMVKKCKGLPLVINALADMLKMHKRPSNWKRISMRLTENILSMGNETTHGVVKDILALSYNELPLHLKPCVLYLHVFPENCEIKAQKLIQMWIAECFVDKESVAEEYLDELAERCIVQVVKTNYKGQVHQVRIHDLIREMVVDMNKERGLLKDPLRLVPRTILYGNEQESYDSHMEILPRYLDGSSHVRSLILFNLKDHCNLKLQPLFEKLRLLRVLILDDIPMKELPQEIGELIHLRYLELSGEAYHLPGSIGNLENLLTIDIRKLDTSTVHMNLEKLKELRHLYMPKKVKIDVLKLDMLKKLKTLWGAKGGNWMLLVMPNLCAALRELCVHDIESGEQLMALLRTPSITSNNLHTLVLSWDSSRVQLKDMSILGMCKSLIKLKLVGRIEVSTCIVFPPSLIELEMACTHTKKEVMSIISESCPYLRILTLRDRAYMKSELVCNANSFPQLEKLKLEALSNVKLWIVEENAMPRLHHLTIKGCKNIRLNPEVWTRMRLHHLTIEGCKNMRFNPEVWTHISMIPQLQCDPNPNFENKLPAYTREGTDSSQGTSVSRLFRYDVLITTTLAISCILLYQLYFWLALKFD